MDTHEALAKCQSTSNSSILLVATNRWSLAARLASGFLDLGCRVAAVCPATGHPITKVRGFNHLYPYVPGSPLKSLRAAIEEFKPDIIVPLCDRSVQHLHELHARCLSDGDRGRQISELIVRSVGPADSFSIVSSRYDLMVVAKQAGISVPDTIRVDSVEDLKSLESRLPCFLKADGTSTGLGVRRAENLYHCERALLQLTNRMSVFSLVERLLLYRDRAWTVSDWGSPRPGIIAQSAVQGRPANCSVVCWKGEVLAGIAVEVVQADGPFEPAIIVQVVDGREMLDAANRIASRLKLTGFFGFDFMIEEKTDKLYLIEMNPRCAPPCSLNLGEGYDLLAAFWAKLTEQKMPQRPAITRKTRIAYFPTAVLRKAVLPTISESDVYLDVPIGEPGLIQELLHPWSEMSLAGRLFHQLRRSLPLKKQLRKISSRFRSEQNHAGTHRWDPSRNQ